MAPPDVSKTAKTRADEDAEIPPVLNPPTSVSSTTAPPRLAPKRTSNILFASRGRSVLLVDIPKSLEEAQVLPGQKPTRRLLSAEPYPVPFPTPKPKDADIYRHQQTPSALLADLMSDSTVRAALEILQTSYNGPCCLPRQTSRTQEVTSSSQNTGHWIPEGAEYIQGTIAETRDQFITTAPRFALIVLDPPWPNRSARRKRGGYSTTSGLDETRNLLSQIPVASHLSQVGLVAVWVTNKPSLIHLLTDTKTGILAEWGLEVVTEWTWLKITSAGEPLYDLESAWRKPWERLIIARRVGSSVKVAPMTILAVPDLHSRKPNLRRQFEDVFSRGFRGLEVFARNLTAGWWSWGDSVLQFQARDVWIDDGDGNLEKGSET